MRYRAVAATVLFPVSCENFSFSKSDGSVVLVGYR